MNEFIEAVKTGYYGDPSSILQVLIELISNPSISNQYFIECASELIIQYQYLVLNSIDLSNNNVIDGFCILFTHKASYIVDKIVPGTRESAACALNILEIALSTRNMDLMHSTLESLIINPMFSVLIASAPLYCYEEFLKIKEKMIEIQKIYKFDKSQGATYLKMAIFAEKITKVKQIYQMLNATNIIISSFYFWIPEYKFLSYFRTYNVRQIYLAAVQTFFDNPTLSNAYLITNYLFRVLPRVAHNLTCVSDIEPFSFNMSAVSEILLSFSEILLKNNQFPITVNELVNLLCSVPNSFGDEQLPDLVLQYPALSSFLVPRFISNSKDPRKISVCVAMLKKVDGPRIEDMRCLICKQNLLEDFLDCLQSLMVDVNTQSDFELVWNYFLYLIFVSWRSNSISLQNNITKYIQKLPSDIRSIVQIMLGIKELNEVFVDFKTIEQVQSSFSYREKCINFFCMLISLEDTLMDQAMNLCKNDSYLWSIFFFWAIASKRKCAHKLMKARFPDNQLLNYVHNIMVYKLTEDIRHPSISYLDINAGICAERNLDEINFNLTKMISLLQELETVKRPMIYSLIVAWRTWFIKFGFLPVCQSIVNIMKYQTEDNTDKDSVKYLYAAVAYLIVSSSERNDNSLHDLVDWIASNITNPKFLNSISISYGLAHFVMVIILSMEELWDDSFKKIIDASRAILIEKFDAVSTPMAFAITIVKLSLYIPIIQPYLPEDLFSICIAKNEWSCAIDFFIALGISNHGSSDESPDFINTENM